MTDILNSLINMINIQNNILNHLDREIDNLINSTNINNDIKKTVSATNVVIINSSKLEQIEKFYFMLDHINSKLYTILINSRNQKERLFNYANQIRKYSNSNNDSNNNKFINILDAHFNGIDGDIQLNPDKHKDMYESIRRYHELHNKIEPKYILQKTAPIINNYTIDIPIVNKLSEIPIMFNWYIGDDTHPEGIYISLSNGLYIQVPFPDTICKNSKNFKHKSIPCKYKSLDICKAKQQEYSRIYGTDIRNCNFVHIGEQYIKIGSDFRCPGLPSFGSFDSLEHDINNISLSDIKTILMNSSSDLLLIRLWHQSHSNLGKIIFTDLDKLN